LSCFSKSNFSLPFWSNREQNLGCQFEENVFWKFFVKLFLALLFFTDSNIFAEDFSKLIWNLWTNFAQNLQKYFNDKVMYYLLRLLRIKKLSRRENHNVIFGWKIKIVFTLFWRVIVINISFINQNFALSLFFQLKKIILVWNLSTLNFVYCKKCKEAVSFLSK